MREIIVDQTFDIRDLLMMKYPNKEVSRELVTEAFYYFRLFFEIDEMTNTYCCGTLDRLSRIIGKDYLSSDLILAIADDFDEEYIPELDDDIVLAWKRSIIFVIGEDAWRKAFRNKVTKKIGQKIIEIIAKNSSQFEFNCDFTERNDVFELIKENNKVFNAICFAIVEYCEEENLDVMTVFDSIDSPDEYRYDVFSIIDRVCYRWYGVAGMIGVC